MGNRLLTGIWRFMMGVPPRLWEKETEKSRLKVKRATAFMSPEHREVHHFVVREMPRLGAPVPAETVARSLDIPLARVTKILRDLEQHLTFLYRNDQGRVVWAYPVTVAKTPHAIRFNTGERLFAA
jgi:hypothetical protein